MAVTAYNSRAGQQFEIVFGQQVEVELEVAEIKTKRQVSWRSFQKVEEKTIEANWIGLFARNKQQFILSVPVVEAYKF